jgi:hypothetical protein
MYRRYANITVWYFFVFSQVPVGTQNSCYLRTYFLLVPHDVSKPKVFNTVIQLVYHVSDMSWHET